MATKKKSTAKKSGKKKVVIKKPAKKSAAKGPRSIAPQLAYMAVKVDALISVYAPVIENVRTELSRHLVEGALTGEERRLAQHILNLSLGVDIETSTKSVYGELDRDEIADLIDKSPAPESDAQVIDPDDGDKYRVTIKAEVTKTFEVNAHDEGEAVEKAHESFDVVTDSATPEKYNEEAVKVEKVSKLAVGDRVKATMRIAFADFNSDNHVHAEEGDEGAVEHIDLDQGDPVATVRFDSSGTATIVSSDEVTKI